VGADADKVDIRISQEVFRILVGFDLFRIEQAFGFGAGVDVACGLNQSGQAFRVGVADGVERAGISHLGG